MMRYFTAGALLMLGLVSFELYNGVTRVKAQQQALETLKKEVVQEAETIRVLKAEWSYLNQPERLQALARRYLTLTPTAAAQIAIPAHLPRRTPLAQPGVQQSPTTYAPVLRVKRDSREQPLP